MTPREREAIFDQDLVDDPPKMGGCNCEIRNRLRNVPSLPILLPLSPAEVIRAVSAQRGSLDSAADHSRERREALPFIALLSLRRICLSWRICRFRNPLHLVLLDIAPPMVLHPPTYGCPPVAPPFVPGRD